MKLQNSPEVLHAIQYSMIVIFFFFFLALSDLGNKREVFIFFNWRISLLGVKLFESVPKWALNSAVYLHTG